MKLTTLVQTETSMTVFATSPRLSAWRPLSGPTTRPSCSACTSWTLAKSRQLASFDYLISTTNKTYIDGNYNAILAKVC